MHSSCAHWGDDARARTHTHSPDNALRMRALGRSLGAHDLYDAAHNMIMEEFIEV